MLSSNSALAKDAENDPLGIKEVLAKEYFPYDLGIVIPIIYNRCAIAEASTVGRNDSRQPCDSWFSINTISQISNRFLQIKWKISVYVCKSQHNVYVIAFYATNPAKASDQYYVDKYGNCYDSEMNFLKSYFAMHFQRNTIAYRPYAQSKGKSLNIEKFVFLRCLTSEITRLFGSKGTLMLYRFIEAYEYEDEAKNSLIEIKVIFPLFRLLLRNGEVPVSFEVQKIHTLDSDGNHNEVFEVRVKISVYSYIIKDISQIKTFLQLDDILAKAMGVDNAVYDEQCKQIINYLKINNKINWENGSTDLESFIKYINKRFGWCRMLGYGCLNIASRMLTLQNWGTLKLSRLRCIVFWVQYKCTLDYRAAEHPFFDSIVSNDEIITNLCNQFKTILQVVGDCETSIDHQFTNKFTKAYHVNKHFDGLKEFHCHFENNLTQNEIQQLQSVNITRETDITTVNELYLKTCSKYYFLSVADYVFGEDIHNYLEEQEPFEKITYIADVASKQIKGIKKRYLAQGIVGNAFVATIHAFDD